MMFKLLEIYNIKPSEYLALDNRNRVFLMACLDIHDEIYSEEIKRMEEECQVE